MQPWLLVLAVEVFQPDCTAACASSQVLVASPEYLAVNGAPKSPEDLADHKCLVYKLNVSPAEWYIRSEDGPLSKIRLTWPLTANNAEALHSAALGGLGIALLPTWSCGYDVFNSRLERLLAGHEADLVAQETAIHAILLPCTAPVSKSPGVRGLSGRDL